MAIRLTALLLLFLVAVPDGRLHAAAAVSGNEMLPDGIQLPANPVTDFALFYQTLTGKQIIADANLGGPNLSLVVQRAISKQEAAALIESVLVLNGYSIVKVNDDTIKLLGTTKFPRSEAVPLYTDPSQLPVGDEVVSYFMPFRYLKSEEAIAAFTNYAPARPLGGYLQVPSVNAVVVTETAPLVRRLLALKNVIDVEGARTTTKMFTLQRADAEKVVEILSKLFEKTDDAPLTRGAAPAPAPNPANPANPATPNAVPSPADGAVLAGPAPKVQIFADLRTNRVLVVAPESQIAYIQDLIASLDIAVPFDEVLERPLRFVRAGDVLPVLANLLVEGTGKDGQQQKPELIGEGTGDGDSSTGSGSDGSSGGGGGGSSGGLSLNETTSFQAESTKPQAAIVGNARIIADRSVNKILVFGPPEARAKAARFLETLDQEPKQVYLACVIGQLQLDNDLEFGIDYLLKFGSVRILGQGSTENIQNLLANRSASIETVVDTTVGAAAAAASGALPALSGLTVFGAIAEGVDVVARALGSTGNFKIVSRPVIYTANGQGALISSGQEVPVPVNSLSSVVDTTGNNNTGTSVNTQIDYKRVVLQLDIRPLINSPNEVTLEIKQRNDNVQSNVTVANNTVPVIATQTLNTTVTVPNRQTIILGGLISEQDERSQTGIPFLKDIPGLGYLFSTTRKDKTRRELIIMIQPFIINSDESLQKVQYIERGNTNFREGMFDTPVPIKPGELPTPEELNNPKLYR